MTFLRIHRTCTKPVSRAAGASSEPYWLFSEGGAQVVSQEEHPAHSSSTDSDEEHNCLPWGIGTAVQNSESATSFKYLLRMLSLC